MKTDKIFYKLFQMFPELLFEILGKSATLAQRYEFKAVELKELSFRTDGIFTPKEIYPTDPIYFLEVQFQKKDDFYWRFITETFIYLGQYQPVQTWQAVVMWASRSIEPPLPLAYQHLLITQQLTIIYLDELSPDDVESIGLGIIKFIVSSQTKATEQVQSLILQAKSQITDDTRQTNVIEFIETIIIYKFPQLSREALENMFDLTSWRQTRFYQDAKVEGKVEGKAENKVETIPRLSKLGLSYEQIAQALELDINFVRQILEKSRVN